MQMNFFTYLLQGRLNVWFFVPAVSSELEMSLLTICRVDVIVGPPMWTVSQWGTDPRGLVWVDLIAATVLHRVGVSRRYRETPF